ncbi:MAG: hypothetical protein JXA33_11725 [Anaerolineae bacterium]|nr:hypothetical protein [Anaerolineae bacterium]
MNKSKLYIWGIVLALMATISGGNHASATLSSGDREQRVVPRIASIVSPLLQYQGRLTDPGTGEAVADGAYSMTFSLYDVASEGTALWTETKNVTVQRGIFSTALGDTTALDTSLFNGQGLWLSIAVQGDPEATPRQQFLPVAYALSLVPGAQVTGQEDNEPALSVAHTGDGNGLHSTISSTNTARSAIYADNLGLGFGIAGTSNGSESAGVLGYNNTGGAGVMGESNDGHGVYGLSWGQDASTDAGVKGESYYTSTYGVLGTSKYGIGGYFTSTTMYGLQGETAATGAGRAGVLGQAGAGAVNLNRQAGVLGKSADGFGVAGVSTDHYGVVGFSYNSYGMWAESLGDMPALYARNYGSSGAPAIYAGGSMTVTRDLEVRGDVLGQNGTSLPIAYGFVNSNGTLASGTANVATALYTTTAYYEITISGHSYYYTDYVTQVTLVYPCSYANTVRTSSGSGRLFVLIYSDTGSFVQCAFQFVTYKP